jgi:hypothetical protein
MMLTIFKRMKYYFWEEKVQSLGRTSQKWTSCFLIFRVGGLNDSKKQGKLRVTGAQLQIGNIINILPQDLPGKFIQEGSLTVIGTQVQHSKMITQVGTKQMPQDHRTLTLQGHPAMVDGTGSLVILVKVVVGVQCGNQRNHTLEVVTVGGKPREQTPQAHRTSPFQDHLTLRGGTRGLVILVQVVAEEQHGNQVDQAVEVGIVETVEVGTAILDREGVPVLHQRNSGYMLKLTQSRKK